MGVSLTSSFNSYVVRPDLKKLNTPHSRAWNGTRGGFILAVDRTLVDRPLIDHIAVKTIISSGAMTFRENDLSTTQSGTCFDRNVVNQRPVDRGPVDRENETALERELTNYGHSNHWPSECMSNISKSASPESETASSQGSGSFLQIPRGSEIVNIDVASRDSCHFTLWPIYPSANCSFFRTVRSNFSLGLGQFAPRVLY